MGEANIVIDELPSIEITDAGVKIIAVSAGKRYIRTFSRAIFRAYMETGIRLLNEFEREERKHLVLPFNACPHVGRPCERWKRGKV
ncbi:MAG: hypothetical protein J7496_08680 [Novosphingobium sp.]|nr:hypothetical protein [Novosphingobium sp.]